MKEIIIFILGLFFGSLFQQIWNIRHPEKLHEVKSKLRENSKHGLVYLTPRTTGKLIRVHTKASVPKSYLWRWPPKHPGGRPTGPQGDTDRMAIELQRAGISDDEIFAKLYAPSLTENIRQDSYLVRLEKANVIRRLKRLTKNSVK